MREWFKDVPSACIEANMPVIRTIVAIRSLNPETLW